MGLMANVEDRVLCLVCKKLNQILLGSLGTLIDEDDVKNNELSS